MDGKKCNCMNLHVMRQNDMGFVQCLNNIQTKVPEPGSPEDIMLQACELKVMKLIQSKQCMSMQKMYIAMNGTTLC